MSRLASLLLLPAVLLTLTACSDGDKEPASSSTAVPSPAPAEQTDTAPVSAPVPDADTSAPQPAITVRYQCASDLIVEATYGDETATLIIDGERYSLTQQVSASGALYGNDAIEWHTTGDEAVLSGGDDTRVCLRITE